MSPSWTAAHVFAAPIVTKIEPFKGFYPAEGYHQDFLVHNPKHPYIVYNDLPKMAALKRVWPQYYRDQPGAFAGHPAAPLTASLELPLFSLVRVANHLAEKQKGVSFPE